MELYSTTLQLWFGEEMVDDEYWEDEDRVLSVERVPGPAPLIMIINRNRPGPKGPQVEWVYTESTGKFIKRES